MGQRHAAVLGQEPEGGGPAEDALPQAQVPRPLRRQALRDHEGQLRAGGQEISHQASSSINAENSAGTYCIQIGLPGKTDSL